MKGDRKVLLSFLSSAYVKKRASQRDAQNARYRENGMNTGRGICQVPSTTSKIYHIFPGMSKTKFVEERL